MKVSDYIAQFLAEHGITHAFGMSGGAAVHMFDSMDRRSDMNIVSMTHEQCAAMAADGYARASGRMGVAVCTSGPGATNLLTGTCCSYYDSIPTLMLTGQVSTHRLKGERLIRQLGFQETDVLSIFGTVTKYAVQLKSATEIKYVLEKAFHIAFEGRPGPVLIDIPDDLQRSEIEPSQLNGYLKPLSRVATEVLKNEVQELFKKISLAKRPVLILGGGLKTPDLGLHLERVLKILGVPALVTWAGLDLIESNNPLRIGTFGVYGSRAGNFAVQNADLVIALGTRLSQNLTGGILQSFARGAQITMVDVDPHEMSKFDGNGIDISQRICAQLSEFLRELESELTQVSLPKWDEWKGKLYHWKTCFPADPLPIPNPDKMCLDANSFIDRLSSVLPQDAIIFADTGGNLTWTCNSLKPKRGQRVHSAWNHTPMGYSLPAAIGAAMARSDRPITCIIGDGGFMICVAELASAAQHNLPIKIFLFNNHSHGIQKQTLETWLEGRKVGVDPASGVAFPKDWLALANSFGLPAITIDHESLVAQQLKDIYLHPGPLFINVEINPEQKLYPVLKFGSALENQLPHIPEEEILREMIVPPFEVSEDLKKRSDQKSQGW
jgi:acetolactate synthase-1/2/3 large subunit